MNQLLAIPFELRLVLLFLVGVVVAGLLNLAIYSLAWNARAISPWSAPPSGVGPRRWSDRLPIAGWWLLRREATVHGRGFWIRPLAVEVCTGALFALLYWWEVSQAGLLGAPLVGVPGPGAIVGPLIETVHAQYFSHLLLVALMIVASLIDVDEKTIPDTVTVPGALVGLMLAACCPSSLLPRAAWLLPGKKLLEVEVLTMVSPSGWPAALTGPPEMLGLWLAIGCWLFWCFALLPRRWNTRHGWKLAWRVFWHRLRLEPSTRWLAGIGLVGSLGITALWQWGGNDSWAALVTSLVGLAAGAAIIWAVRVVGSMALGREAMGFGDVTLMAMIGAFLGWQAVLIVFFLAPFAGLVLGVGQWLVHRENEIPFGPFLCLAALATIVGWARLWPDVEPLFAIGWLVPTVMTVCVVMLGLLLGLWRIVRGIVFRT